MYMHTHACLAHSTARSMVAKGSDRFDSNCFCLSRSMLHLCVCVYMCVCVRMCMCMRMCMRMCLSCALHDRYCIYVYVCCVLMYMITKVYVYSNVQVCVCMYACLHACMCLCI